MLKKRKKTDDITEDVSDPIYLDYNASTPIAAEVAEVMRPYLGKAYGNPSSTHWAGSSARKAVDTARAQVASLIGANPEEIVFTSGGTEANNMSIKGSWWRTGSPDGHIITTSIEHPATLNPCAFLEKHGAKVSVVGVDRFGWVDPAAIRDAITDKTFLITIMHANNEVGTIEPIAEIAKVAREKGILFHCDVAQSIGKIPVKVAELGVDLLSVAGHKLYGPKGVGALYIRKGVALESLLHGGGHEGGRRAGTESALMTAGLGAACELAEKRLPLMAETKALRDYFWDRLQQKFGDRICRNGHPEKVLPNTLNVSFLGRSGAEVLAELKGVAASTGSACHEGEETMSPVLKAMGASDEVGFGAVRFSLGRSTTRAAIDSVLDQL